MEKPLKVRLHIISPVHIGGDDVYEPTSFVIDEKKNKLIEFDLMEFIKSLSLRDRQEFTRICMEGSISSIIKMYDFISRKQVKGWEIEIANELVAHYKKVKNLSTNNEKSIKQELNQFAINRTVYNPHNNQPYIPGSSVKGAMKTAYLSKLAKDKEIKGRKEKAKELEKELLEGSFDTDPFRMVKPSDFLPVSNVKTKIVYAVNKKKKNLNTSPREGRGNIPQILEVIKEESIFEGTIHIQQPEPTARIKKPVQSNELLDSMHDYYRKIVNEEDDIVHNIGAGRVVVNSIINKFKESRGKSAFLLRIGRHSGAESMTIEGNRWIKISPPGRPHKFSDNGATTIWLASESSKPNSNNRLVPFGWAVMEIMT